MLCYIFDERFADSPPPQEIEQSTRISLFVYRFNICLTKSWLPIIDMHRKGPAGLTFHKEHLMHPL